MHTPTGNFDSICFSRSYALFELRNLAKVKDTTETVCQRNSSETAQQNFVKLCSCEGHTMYMCIPRGNFGSIFFFIVVTPFLGHLRKSGDPLLWISIRRALTSTGPILTKFGM